jgi:nucleoside-diphosphate-sugar epimerase
VNVVGTRVLLDAAAAAGVARFVHVSTHAIDPSGGAYSRSKAEAERLVSAAPVETVVVRLPEVIGGGREGIDALVDSARSGRPILVVGRGDHELRPAHVDEVAAAVAAAVDAEVAAGGTYTLGAQPLTLREAAETARDACGGRSRIVTIPEPLVALLCRASRFLPLPLYPDQLQRLRARRPPPSADAERDLGYRPRALADIVCAPQDSVHE